MHRPALSHPPAPDIVRAFGVSGVGLTPLRGGQGRTWSDGRVVLKPVDNPAEHVWVAEVCAAWVHHDVVRVPRPLRSLDGAWVHGGWAAHEWAAGRDASMAADSAEIRQAGEDFHRLVSGLERPGFLDDRDDPWAHGDRVAWEGAEPEGDPVTRALVRRIRSAFEPVASPPQVLHGDIGGNVLLADGLPPAVIDWPPYFRPAGFALAVTATDAVCWEGVPLQILDEWSDVPEWDQLLLRALAYRIGTVGRGEALREWAMPSIEHADRVRPAMEAVLARIG